MMLFPFGNGLDNSIVPSGLRIVVCATPRRLLLPIGAVVTDETVRLELNPPPIVWAAGCSKVAPSKSTVPPHGLTTPARGDDERTRKSASNGPPISVVMSTTRNRRRVTVAPVLLVTLRRIESVPKVELFIASGVGSRNLPQALFASGVTHPGSINDSLIVELR